MNYSYMLEGKTAVVTCGDSAIGATVAKLFARHGAVVAFGAKTARAAEDTIGAVCDASPGSYYWPCDLADAESVEAFCAEINRREPLVNVLVNNPWMFSDIAFEDADDGDDSRILQVYQRSIMQTLRAFWPAMLKAGRCSVVNISSFSVFKAVQGALMFTMANGAVGGMTRVPAVEGGYCEVRVNEILAGYDVIRDACGVCGNDGEGGDDDVCGDDGEGGESGDDDAYGVSGIGAGIDAKTGIGAGRIYTLPRGPGENRIDVECVANTALFLASDMASYVSGISLSVSGGLQRMRLP